MINRQVGVTFSTWNRKLDTGDFKDYVITDAEAFAERLAVGRHARSGSRIQFHGVIPHGYIRIA